MRTAMRTTTRALVGVAAGAALAATACGPVGNRFREPEVAFKGVTVKGVGFNGGSVDILLQVKNPNRFALDASRITYKLLVGDSLVVGSGATDQRFRVEAKDSATVPLPLDFQWSGLGQAGRDLMNTGTVNYRVMGDITVGSALGNYTIPYDRRGRFATLSGGSR